MPFPQDEFAKDFEASQWQLATDCLKHAVIEEVICPVANRPDAYHETGIRTVDESDILLAVWDGKPAQGKGGTGDVVAYARELKKPIIWIHTETHEIIRERFDESDYQDSILGQLIAQPQGLGILSRGRTVSSPKRPA